MLRRLVNLQEISGEKNLYHYTKCSGVQGILAGQSFRATRSDFLNDTNEMQYILTAVRPVIESIEPAKWQHLLMDEVVDITHELRKKPYYVTAFSTESDSITLWSEFGEQTGYNLGFDSYELLKRIAKERPISYHGYVIYSAEEQQNIIRELLFERIPGQLGISFEEIMKRREQDTGDEIFERLCRSFRKALAVYALFFKQEEFAAEREYRIAFRDPVAEVFFREKDGFLLPYIWVNVSGGKKKFPLKSITVAPKNHVDLAREGMKLYVEKMGYEVEVGLSKIKLRY